MKHRATASQRAVSNIRKRLRLDMQRLALTHKNCDVARGCGCLVDKSLEMLQTAESGLFMFEIDSYADPSSPRRIVQPDNSIGETDGDACGAQIARQTEEK